ncbi:hypothetical protein ACFL1K_03555 [Candidatus Omnitrophota bacterium]
MKKVLAVALIALLLAPVVALAEPEGKEGMERKHKKMGMMGMMMKKQMVATKDGGVVVMAGNRLLKYDKKLKLVAEAEVKMDYKVMKEKMMKMKKECMMKKEKEEGQKTEE